MSQSPASPDARPDSSRILEELEQLQQAIRATRAKGERAEAAVVPELRAVALPASLPPAAPRTGLPVAGLGPPPTPVVTAAAVLPAPPQSTLPKPSPPRPVAVFDDTNPPDAPVAPRSRTPLIAGAIAVVVFASGLFFWNTRGSSDVGVRPAGVTQSAATATRAPEEPAPAAKPVVVDPHALRVDLTSQRRVWLRVSVDGRIALEREVDGGERLPFGADRSIVVRAGDAGAVTVRVGADDQGPLGRDGQVVTRAFTAPVR